jgi:hypothetical protein
LKDRNLYTHISSIPTVCSISGGEIVVKRNEEFMKEAAIMVRFSVPETLFPPTINDTLKECP